MILNLAILSALYRIFHMYPLYFHAFAVTLSDTNYKLDCWWLPPFVIM